MRAIGRRGAAILAGTVLVGSGGGWLLAHERGDGGTPDASETPTESVPCKRLTSALTASFVLQDDDSAVGESLFPRITVRNDGEVDVRVALRASASVGSRTMGWSTGTNPLEVPAGATRPQTFDSDGSGEGIEVADGPTVTKVSASGTVETEAGKPAGCALKVRRASTAVVPVCLDDAPPASRPYPGVPLSATSGTDLVDDVKTVQQQLNALGGECTVIDGVFGKETTRIVREFQRTSGLPATGVVDRETWDALFAAS